MNNIKISGLEEKPNKESETDEETIYKVLESAEKQLKTLVKRKVIDIAHRLKKSNNGKRDIIVKLQLRMEKKQDSEEQENE